MTALDRLKAHKARSQAEAPIRGAAKTAETGFGSFDSSSLWGSDENFDKGGTSGTCSEVGDPNPPIQRTAQSAETPSAMSGILALYRRRAHQEPPRRAHFYEITLVSVLNVLSLDEIRGDPTRCGQCGATAADYLCIGDRLYWTCGPECRQRTQERLQEYAADILAAYAVMA